MIGYKEVNAGLAGVIEYMRSIENVWNTTRNLKLYDVSFHASEIIEKYPLVKQENNESDLFYNFCETQYDCFTEWIEEENIDKKTMVYIGRTSSFYLTDLHDENIGTVISDLLSRISYGYIDIDIAGTMIPFTASEYYTEEEQIEEAQAEMNYIACGDFLKDVKEYMQDAVKLADYIDSFKEHQIEYFTEEIEYLNSEIEEERERQEQEEKAFTDRYAGVIDGLAENIKEVLNQTAGNTADMRRIVNKSVELVTA